MPKAVLILAAMGAVNALAAPAWQVVASSGELPGLASVPPLGLFEETAYFQGGAVLAGYNSSYRKTFLYWTDGTETRVIMDQASKMPEPFQPTSYLWDIRNFRSDGDKLYLLADIYTGNVGQMALLVFDGGTWRVAVQEFAKVVSNSYLLSGYISDAVGGKLALVVQNDSPYNAGYTGKLYYGEPDNLQVIADQATVPAGDSREIYEFYKKAFLSPDGSMVAFHVSFPPPQGQFIGREAVLLYRGGEVRTVLADGDTGPQGGAVSAVGASSRGSIFSDDALFFPANESNVTNLYRYALADGAITRSFTGTQVGANVSLLVTMLDLLGDSLVTSVRTGISVDSLISVANYGAGPVETLLAENQLIDTYTIKGLYAIEAASDGLLALATTDKGNALISSIDLALPAGAPWYAGVFTLGGNYYYSDYLGYFYPIAGSDWIWQAPDRFLYVISPANDPVDLFLYDYASAAWWYAGTRSSPYWYRYGAGAGWHYILPLTGELVRL